MAASRRPRPRAIVLAEHGELPVRLTPDQHDVLEEARSRGEDCREQVESTVTSYGRWLLSAVFDNDAAAALDDKSDNPVWREIIRRAGGPTLKVSRRLLYVALKVAARDKRITDQTWRGLDSGRKELLLPLGRDDRMREAARHVSKFNLTQSSTRQYVSELLKSDGKPRAVRLTMPRLVSNVQKLRVKLGSAAALKRVADLRDSVGDAERAKAAEEVQRWSVVLDEVAKALRGKR
jgi:hypothetical protein